jgi:hypothetical protein
MVSTVRRFNASEIRTVTAALAAAEERTGRFYCIPGREWQRLPYDVTTLASGQPPEEWAFADVVRVCPARSTAAATSGRGGIPEHFRIRLRDDVFLSTVDDRHRGIDLFPLLLWVLTHELIHVVRFGCGMAPFEVDADARRHEERRVHAITGRVLRPENDDGLLRAAVLVSPSRPATFRSKAEATG